MSFTSVTSMWGHISYACGHCRFVSPHLSVMKIHEASHPTRRTGILDPFGAEVDVIVAEDNPGEVDAEHLGDNW